MDTNLDPSEKAKLEAEWAKAQGLGKRLSRQRAIATVAAVVVTFLIGVPGELVMMALWPADRVPILYLALAPAVAIAAGAAVRSKLWPKGQFA